MHNFTDVTKIVKLFAIRYTKQTSFILLLIGSFVLILPLIIDSNKTSSVVVKEEIRTHDLSTCHLKEPSLIHLLYGTPFKPCTLALDHILTPLSLLIPSNVRNILLVPFTVIS